MSKKSSFPKASLRNRLGNVKPGPTKAEPISETSWHGTTGGVGLALLLAASVWSYFPNWRRLVESWNSLPDYSHGFFVIPIAIYFLYVRRGTFPKIAPSLGLGFVLVGLSLGVRRIASGIYLDALDDYSMLVWLSGVIVAMLGWRVFVWSIPAVGFLLFMIPMPYQLEHALRAPLQNLATQWSTKALVFFGYPAIAESNVVRIGNNQFGVEEACSGLRIFVGILALAVSYVVISKRAWWIKGLILLSVIPVTLISNCTRIVATCWLEMQFSSAVAQKFSHDFAGFLMIPFAAALFGLLLLYMGMVFREAEPESVRNIIRYQVKT